MGEMQRFNLLIFFFLFLFHRVNCRTVSVTKPVSGFVQMFVKFGDKMIRIKSSQLFAYKVNTLRCSLVKDYALNVSQVVLENDYCTYGLHTIAIDRSTVDCGWVIFTTIRYIRIRIDL